MNSTLGLLLDVATLFVATAWILSAFAALVPLPRVPALRAREAFRLAMLPGVGGALIVGIAGWPHLRAMALGEADHCAVGLNPHLCWLHATAGPPTWHDVAAIALVTTFMLTAAWRLGSWALALRRLDHLEPASDPRRGDALMAALAGQGVEFPGPVWVVPSARPLCFVMGVRRQTLVVATSVVDALPVETLAPVIAHETSHVLRRDPVARTGVGIATIAHAPGLGHRAANRWAEAAERACDEGAATQVGSRLAVAQALVRYQRLVNGALAQPGLAFCGGEPIEARVRALLEEPVATRDRRRAWPWLSLAAVAFQADALHTGLERLLALIHA